MHAALHLLAAGPAPGPALPSPVTLGPVGEWLLPALIIGVGIIVDSTAAGGAAKRDRVAALCTYTGTLGLISVYGWQDGIRGQIGSSWSVVVLASAAAFLIHAGLVVVMIGDANEETKRLGAWIGKKIGFDSKNGNAVGKLNTKLHLWATAAACSYVLSRGPSQWVPREIGEALTHVSGKVGMWLVHWFGG